jgi:ERCC4-related helicase
MKAYRGDLLLLTKKSQDKKNKTQTILVTTWNVTTSLITHKQQIEVPLSHGKLKQVLSLENNFFSICFEHSVVVFQKNTNNSLYHLITSDPYHLTSSLLGEEKSEKTLFPSSSPVTFKFDEKNLCKEISEMLKNFSEEKNNKTTNNEQTKGKT